MTKTKRIEVVSYNPAWAIMYEDEARQIGRVLGGNLLEIHHVGSTSVPDLAAKPKIDIVAAVAYPEQAMIDLPKVGFTHKGEWNVPFKYGFTKRGERDVNLHLFKQGNPEIELNVMFRDYLRNYPEVRDAYARLKYDILQDAGAHRKSDGMFPVYTLRKGDFIRDVLRKAGFKRLRMLRCNDDTEWCAAKELRRKYWHGLGRSDHVSVPDKGHEHFLLYRGVEILGYADVSCGMYGEPVVHMMVFDSDEDAAAYADTFRSLVDEWFALHGC